jgi:hypothetical protein
MKNILTDIVKWLRTEATIIALTTAARIVKYQVRTSDNMIFGRTGYQSLVLDLLPGVNFNNTSSQFSAALEIRCYASNTVDANKVKTADDAEDKAWILYYIVDKVLQNLECDDIKLTNFLIFGGPHREMEGTPSFDDTHECPFIIANYGFNYYQL